MMKVAVAGGGGRLGLHIVEALLASPKHTPVVLTRVSSTSASPDLAALGIQIIPVDYRSRSALVSALTAANIHTVISTMGSDADMEQFVVAEIELAHACKEAPCVRRFAPSEFCVRAVHDDTMSFYKYKTRVADALRAISGERGDPGSALEWTIFECGLFMNYLAVGTPGLGHLAPLKPGIDFENHTAQVPGDGDAPCVFTRVEDVGAFVVASLELERWPEVCGMEGERATYNEYIKMAEQVTGRKFTVQYIPVDALRSSMNPTPQHVMENFAQEIFIVIAEGKRFNFVANLNALCPAVSPVGAREFMSRWWADQPLEQPREGSHGTGGARNTSPKVGVTPA